MPREIEATKLQRNLAALIEFSRMVNSSRDLDFTLNNLLFSTLGKFLTTRGFVALNFNGELKVAAQKGIAEEETNDFPQLKADIQILQDNNLIHFADTHNFPLIEIIETSSRCLGIICLGEKINKSPYTPEEKEFLKTILNIAATAIENSLFIDELKQVNRNLDSRINRLNALFELTKEFGILTEEVRIGKLFLYSLLGNFLVSTYAIVYNENNKTRILESTVPKSILNDFFKGFNYDSIDTHLSADEIEKKFPKLAAMQFEIIVPLKLQHETKGLMLLGKRANNLPYDEPDIEFIYSIGSLATVSLENKRLFIEALEKQRLVEELEVAKGIQKNLFPDTLPSFAHFEIAASSVSSKQVGGDYYDIIKKDDNNYYAAIGDVVGKGVPAALLMANLQAFLKSICKQDLAIDDATGLINDLVAENISDGKFITFFWCIFNTANNSCTYVNAGHNPPLLIRDGEIRYLDKGGMILGVMKTMAPYIKEEVQLKEGDCIVLFTDGVTEAMNPSEEEFSDERFEQILLENAHLSAAEIKEKVNIALMEFTKGALQSDDITMVILKVT